MKTGILGGTFNPPHLGHLIVAERVREEFALDRILFVPAAISPHKRHIELIDATFRMEMVQLAVLGRERFTASDIEIGRGGVSYTVDTLVHVQRMNPGDTHFLLIGMDNLIEFDTWKAPERIVELANVVVMTRPGFKPNGVPGKYGKKVKYCQVPEIEISSSEIRARVKQGKSIRFLVPKPVESYIYFRKLYTAV